LTTKALKLLEFPQKGYEYLHLVWFFRARAAMLALQGSVLDHKDLFRALSKYRVQAAGIYREHLIFNVREFLRKQNLGGLPGCHCENSAAVEENEKAERNRDVIRAIVRGAEIEYLRTLNFISAATTMEEEVARHSVGFWADGAEMPKGLDIQVRVRRFDGGYEVRPTEDDIKRMVREGTSMRKIMVREAGSGKREGESAERGALRAEMEAGGRRLKTTDSGPMTEGGERRTDRRARPDVRGPRAADRPTETTAGTETGSRIEETAKVIGDYRVIRIPGRRPINLGKKHKTRAMVRFIHESLKKAGKSDFYVEEMRDAFNEQFTGTMAGRQWISDRFREDLFKGKEDEFDLVFEPLDKSTGHYRTKLLGWLGQCGLVAVTIGDWLQWGIGELATGFIGDGLLGAAGMA
jgi:hypothetical protein